MFSELETENRREGRRVRRSAGFERVQHPREPLQRSFSFRLCPEENRTKQQKAVSHAKPPNDKTAKPAQ